MKPFRFAWNGETLSEQDTYTLLTTILIIILSLIAALVFKLP